MKNKKSDMAVGQNLVPLVNIKIAGKWMFIPLKMVLIGIDPYPYVQIRPEKKSAGNFTEPGLEAPEFASCHFYPGRNVMSFHSCVGSLNLRLKPFRTVLGLLEFPWTN